jgi:radical SAM superfamily enzyme YgiQ (UPF0313 family)
MAQIVFISPRFESSFWGLEHSMMFVGKKANIPQACLPLLAAITPEPHQVTLLDENVEEIDFDEVAKADIVGLTAMHVQGVRAKQIFAELKSRGVFTVAGGPLVTVEPGEFGDLVDVVFLGEAEDTWPRFLEEWQAGNHGERYEQAESTDMAMVPLPRLDLLKVKEYMSGSMQISRGCPFQCEFCDIIITFGRRPRLKSIEQVLAEFDQYLAHKVNIVFVVDDNLIGNKKEIKPILRAVAAWQQERFYPITLYTEASLDLAEDEELMTLLGEAGFIAVFVGIESPNEESLRETKKYQNVRKKAGTMQDRLERIQAHHLEVYMGMIVGFDNDDTSVFEHTERFIRETRIAHALVGMLRAIPTTPLYTRLVTEGRVLEGNGLTQSAMTNVVPLKMTRDELRAGYVRIVHQLYNTQAYFDRVDESFITRRFRYALHRRSYWDRHRWAFVRRSIRNVGTSAFMFAQLMRLVGDDQLRREYRRRILRLIRTRPREPHIWVIYLVKVTMHYHYFQMIGEIASALEIGEELSAPAVKAPHNAMT